MQPLGSYDAAFQRARHFLTLYDLLADTRAYRVRKDWAVKFNDLMHWPKGESIVRVDGKDKQSLLILRQAVGIDRTSFSHTYLSELLRAALVAAVSAQDRYLHDMVVSHSWSVLSRKDELVPRKLRAFALPLSITKKALEQLRSDPKCRPGNVVKAALREELHKKTFQDPAGVDAAISMLGITDFWKQVVVGLPGKPTPQQAQESLRAIVKRRNQIVHEADLIIKAKTRKPTAREITRTEAQSSVDWIDAFVRASDTVILSAV